MKSGTVTSPSPVTEAEVQTAHGRCFWTFRTEDSITDEDKRRYVCRRSRCHVRDFGRSAWM